MPSNDQSKPSLASTLALRGGSGRGSDQGKVLGAFHGVAYPCIAHRLCSGVGGGVRASLRFYPGPPRRAQSTGSFLDVGLGPAKFLLTLGGVAKWAGPMGILELVPSNDGGREPGS